MRIAGFLLLLVMLTVACGGGADDGSPGAGHWPSSVELSRVTTSSWFAGAGVSFGLARPEVDGLAVTMNGTIQAHDSNIARFVWNWGEGTIEDSQLPARHAYPEPGRYTISLAVYDDRGVLIAAQSSPIDLAE